MATNKSAGQPCGARGQICGLLGTGLRSLTLGKTGFLDTSLLGNVAFRNLAQHLWYLCSISVFRGRVPVPFH